MLGNLTPFRAEDMGRVCAHVSCWGAQTVRHIRQLPCHVSLPQDSSSSKKQNYTSPRDEEKTAKAGAVRMRNSRKQCSAFENGSTLLTVGIYIYIFQYADTRRVTIEGSCCLQKCKLACKRLWKRLRQQYSRMQRNRMKILHRFIISFSYHLSIVLGNPTRGVLGLSEA